MRDLHARSWARTGIPVVREYQEEYFSRIGVIVDTDEDAADPRTFEAALSLAAGVVAHLSRGEALIDLLVVGDHVHSLTLGRSLGFLEQALDLDAQCSDVAAALRALCEHDERFDAAVVNPPRRGMSPRAREWLARLAPSLIGYVSCDPETLESNIHGIYLAGVIVAGSRTNEIFIENGRFHGRQIARALAVNRAVAL